jgi:hypothetical protein
MYAIVIAPERGLVPRSNERAPREAVDALAGASTAARSELSSWSCGLGPDAGPAARERCREIIPELMVELL